MGHKKGDNKHKTRCLTTCFSLCTSVHSLELYLSLLLPQKVAGVYRALYLVQSTREACSIKEQICFSSANLVQSQNLDLGYANSVPTLGTGWCQGRQCYNDSDWFIALFVCVVIGLM